MDHELHEVIKIIQKEHRSTRRVFGISIIILALLLAILAPGIIRQESQRPAKFAPGELSGPMNVDVGTTTPESAEAQ